jgi:methionyl-tRNA formyltransferase
MSEKFQISGYKSFEPLAKQYNIPIRYVKKYSLKEESDLRFFKENKFDLLIQGGWQRIIPEEILNTLRVGAIGVHGSADYLPKGRGRSPINWSLIEDKERFILHYFLMKPGADDGDIFHREIFDINKWDDCRTLYYKSSLITKNVIEKWIPKLLAGDFHVTSQEGEPSYYPKRTPEDGLINWNDSIKQIYNLIRGITYPYPGAFSSLNGEKIIIWRAQPFSLFLDSEDYKYGEVIEVFENEDFLVKCGSGLLLVRDYECKNKPVKGMILN